MTRHYYRYLKGEKTSTNPIATLFAWTGALGRRAEMDGIDALRDFARRVEAATMKTIAEGVMTGDLAPMTRNPDVRVIDSAGFLAAVADHVRSDG